MEENKTTANVNENSAGQNGAEGKKSSDKRSDKSWLTALIIGISIIGAAALLAFGLSRFRSAQSHTISATGSASQEFESDKIVWRGSFETHDDTTSAAFRQIKRDADTVKEYLEDNDIDSSEYELSSISVIPRSRDVYDDEGNYKYSVADGYDLSQQITVTSEDIDKVEKVSRDITDLLESGIQFSSYSPEYYCTTLDDVKLDLIEKATDNAKDRIDIIAKGSGASCGKLVNSNLGVFQITAANSGTSGYTYDGAFDTTSRMKTASITVKLEYELK